MNIRMAHTGGYCCAKQIMSRLKEEGFQALMVGGCVRDAILGLIPKDYDVCTNATPEQVLRIFPGIQSKIVGAKFGVVLVSLPYLDRTVSLEVASFRTEDAYTDGRRPESVKYARAFEDDVTRRDFTMNGLGLGHELPDGTHEVVDYVGGLVDIQEKTIRCIGSPILRFQEDHLRMLRAIRFSARLNFAIHSETWDALQSKAHQIREISNERIRDEILAMLQTPQPDHAVHLLVTSGLMAQIFPRLMNGSFVRVLRKLRLAVHTDRDRDRSLARSPVFMLAVLMSELPIKDACTSVQILNLSNEEFVAFSTILIRLLQSREIVDWPLARIRRFKMDRMYEQVEHLMYLNAETWEQGDPSNGNWAQAAVLEAAGDPESYPMPLLTGIDLISLGYKPGPLFGRILRQVYDEQLEDRLPTIEQALDYVLENWEKE